jgi:hypothetical protein
MGKLTSELNDHQKWEGFLLWYLSQYSGQLRTRLQIYGSMGNCTPPLHHHHYFLSTITFSVGAVSQTWSFPHPYAYFQRLVNYYICLHLSVYSVMAYLTTLVPWFTQYLMIIYGVTMAWNVRGERWLSLNQGWQPALASACMNWGNPSRTLIIMTGPQAESKTGVVHTSPLCTFHKNIFSSYVYGWTVRFEIIWLFITNKCTWC